MFDFLLDFLDFFFGYYPEGYYYFGSYLITSGADEATLDFLLDFFFFGVSYYLAGSYSFTYSSSITALPFLPLAALDLSFFDCFLPFVSYSYYGTAAFSAAILAYSSSLSLSSYYCCFFNC